MKCVCFSQLFFCTAWLTNCCVLGTKSTWESRVILWNGSSYCSMVSGQTHSCQLLDQSSVELVQGKCLASRGRKPAAMSISTLCWPSKHTSSIQGSSVPALFAGENYWRMPSEWAENGMGGNKAEVEMHLYFGYRLFDSLCLLKWDLISTCPLKEKGIIETQDRNREPLCLAWWMQKEQAPQKDNQQHVLMFEPALAKSSINFGAEDIGCSIWALQLHLNYLRA